MFRSTILSIVFILALAFMVSCSGGGGNVVAPDSTGISEEIGKDVLTTEEPGTTVCLGLWQFVADKATGEADLVQLRSADKILNVLGFMEPPALTSMDLDWPNLNIDFDNGIVDVGVKFKHPINDGIFTGFDVRGVVFGPKVTNADGLTIIPSPEFFKGVPFGYQDGLIGIPDSHANYEGLAGYKYYCDGLGDDEDLAEFFSDPANLDKRGKFSPNKTIQRNYNLSWNNVEHQFLDFNYALYANYDWPVGMPPWYIDDWEMSTANSAEAFCCSVTELASNLHYYGGSGGGNISLKVEIWDWQGDIADVTIKSFEPGVIAETSYDVALGNMGTDYSYGFEFNDVPGSPNATGDLDILITVTDSKTFGECWFLDLLPASNSMYDENIYNCWTYTTTVASGYIEVLTPNGGDEWKPGTSEDITWDSGGVTGTVFIDYSRDNFVSDVHAIATDEPNDGTYTWANIPYHPSDTVRVRVSSTDDPTVFDISDADFTLRDKGWARNWGGWNNDLGHGVAVDDSGNTYVTGTFRYTVDFDPGPGTDNHTSSGGNEDIFLSKFDSSGNFQWARIWGGGSMDYGYGVAVDDSGNAYATGSFYGSVDFDPGTGIDNHTSNGGMEIFLSKFNSSGGFQWARTWGGSSHDVSYGVAVDDSGNAYATGYFYGTVDFDPGLGVDKHYGGGLFLSKFNSNGNFQWARTWGEGSSDYGHGIAVDDFGNVYITGYFTGTVNFDPGPGTDNHTSNGGYDCFLSKFDSSGDFQWACTWGGNYTEYSYGVAADDSGNVCVTGYFKGTVDFDPGAGVDNHTANGSYEDIFLSKFDSNGDFQWARTWGDWAIDQGFGVALDDSGNAYVTGLFMYTVDFDPGPGTDNHTSIGNSRDIFLSKFDSNGDYQWARTWGSGNSDSGYGVAVDDSSNTYVTGYFQGTVDFDPGPGIENLASHGYRDVFLVKLLPDGYW